MKYHLIKRDLIAQSPRRIQLSRAVKTSNKWGRLEQETENTNSATSWNQMLKYTILWEPFSAEHSDVPAL